MVCWMGSVSSVNGCPRVSTWVPTCVSVAVNVCQHGSRRGSTWASTCAIVGSLYANVGVNVHQSGCVSTDVHIIANVHHRGCQQGSSWVFQCVNVGFEAGVNLVNRAVDMGVKGCPPEHVPPRRVPILNLDQGAGLSHPFNRHPEQ